MAATLKKRFRIESDLKEGGGGVFKVWADEELLWDKKTMERFPEESEIVDKLVALGAS